MSDPIKSESGHHPIEVLDKKEYYEELEGNMEERITQEQSKSATEVMEE